MKVLSVYTTMDIDDKRQRLYEGVMFFSEQLVENCEIMLEDGKGNQFSRAFELIVACVNEAKDTEFGQGVKGKAQEILNKAFMKLCNWEYCERIMTEFGKNQKSEIECFE